MKYVLLDNEKYQMAVLSQILGRLPSDTLRAESKPAQIVAENWADAFEKLQGLASTDVDADNQELCVALLDLALDRVNATAAEGVAQIKGQMNGVLRPYVVIAWTRYPLRAKEIGVDAVLDKTEAEQPEEEACRLVEAAIEMALTNWQRRTRRQAPAPTPPRWQWQDSAATRRADAALGVRLLDELVRRESSRWKEVRLTALSGGYSGSYVVRLDGKVDEHSATLVCKIATDRAVLESETESWSHMAATYSQFVGLVPPVVSAQPKALGGGQAWYTVQAAAPGRTLEQVLIGSCAEGPPAMLETAMVRLVEMADAAAPLSCPPPVAPVRMVFTDQDVGRGLTAIESLSQVYKRCVQKGAVPRAAELRVVSALARTLQAWNGWLTSGRLDVACAFQHGDLNVRNILITEGGVLQLIDFARSGSWPVGYDLSRLNLQAFARVCDVSTRADEFPDRLKLWPASRDLRRTNKSYMALVDVIRAWRQRAAQRYGDSAVEKCTAVSECYDALRMCSYQDISVFKRVFLLAVAARAAEALRSHIE